MKFAKPLAALSALAFSCCLAFAADSAPQADLKSLLEGASDGSIVKVPAGVYKSDKTITLKGKKDIYIDALGAKLVMGSHVSAIDIRSCENLTLKGLTIDYDPLPFTQAELVSYDPVTMQGEIALMKGYPRLDEVQHQGTVMVFDKASKLWKRDSYGFYGAKFESMGPDRAKISVSAPSDANLAAGDLLVIEKRNVAGLNIVLAKNLTLDGLIIQSAPGIAMIGRYCSGQQIIRNVRIEKGPKPAGADCERLYSTGADGLNYAVCRQGPTVLNCDFGFMGDDSINFHGETLPVFAVESETSAIIMRFGGKSPLADLIQKGDKAQIMNGDSFAVEAESSIASYEFIESRAASDADKEAIVKTYPSRDRKNVVNDRISFYRMKFEKPVQLKAGQWIDIPALNCPGYSVIGNRFHDHRARGLRLMAQDGVIADNVFERIGQSAISIGAEYNFWRESGWCRNIVIARNTVKDCGIHMDATMPGAYACGAICVFTYRSKDAKEIHKGHSNIVIDSNIVEGNSAAGIHLYGVRDAFITKNVIAGAMSRNCSKTGRDKGLKVDGPISAMDCENIIEEGNEIK